ncbi:hypothetical protein CG007_01675 [Mesoplasma entomophilum]|uniref:DUF262 domain-containing protein n=1 Tax=Mesoplasma entomophilum TaxID=2149 RepID=UPI000D0262E2|nr:DUF262 domain-containing protein [Mesoplasma entomophilum]AVN60325.1 hypothetical protein CG007_01675 [Mesoplasma entomophilum]
MKKQKETTMAISNNIKTLPELTTVKNLLDDIENENITLPNFQRNKVWTKKMKENFKETLKKDFPFGSILIHKKDGSDKQLLIDGYQRLSTIKEFCKEPFSDLKWEDFLVDDNEFITIFENEKNYKKFQKKFLENLKNSENSFNTFILIESSISQTFSRGALEQEQIYIKAAIVNKVISSKISEIKLISYKIQEKKVPVIYVTTFKDHEIIADIFTNLNTSGQKLSKYEIAASDWENVKILINDYKRNQLGEKILNKIKSKYDYYEQNKNKTGIKMNKSSTDIELGKEIDLFEILFGFSKVLEENSNNLFNPTKNQTIDIFQEGFEIINYCLGGTNKAFSKLNNLFIDKFKTEDGFVSFSKILNFFQYVNDVTKVINDYFGEDNTKILLGSVNNKNISWGKNENDNKLLKPSKFQSISFIVEIFRTLFENEYDFIDYDKDIVKKIIKMIKEDFYIGHHFIYDTFTNLFSSSSNKTVDAITNENKFRYSDFIPKEDMEKAIDNVIWEYNNSISHIIRPKFDKSIKIIISIAYKGVWNKNLNNQSCHIDHLIPFNLNSKLSEKIQINKLGNLALLNSDSNSIKSDKDLFKLIEQNKFNKNDVAEWTFLNEKDFKLFSFEEKQWIDIEKNLEKLCDIREKEFKSKLLNFLYEN